MSIDWFMIEIQKQKNLHSLKLTYKESSWESSILPIYKSHIADQ